MFIWNAGLFQTQAPFFGCGPAHFLPGGLGVVHVRFLCENTGFDSYGGIFVFLRRLNLMLSVESGTFPTLYHCG